MEASLLKPVNDHMNISKCIQTELEKSKQYLDLQDDEVIELERKTNLSFKCNIGFGGFSTVKLAYSEKSKNFYAVKIINLLNPKKFRKKTLSKRKDFVDQEIYINLNSKHSNIVKLYDYFQFKHYYLLFLEYLPKKDLKSFLKKFYKSNTSMSEVLAAYFVIEILKGLTYLKNNHIIHRDIKPENIMISGDYIAKIGDFSLSKKVDIESMYQTSRSGTIPYLPPESVKCKINKIKGIFTEKLDIFSFGIILYFMLFNEHPFGYKNGMTYEDYYKHLKGNPSYFSSYCSNISSQCKSLIDGMLHKNIKKRFTLEQITNHPWILICTKKIETIRENYSYDPDKMILELNRVNFQELKEIENYNEIQFELELKDNNLLNKKRKAKT